MQRENEKETNQNKLQAYTVPTKSNPAKIFPT